MLDLVRVLEPDEWAAMLLAGPKLTRAELADSLRAAIERGATAEREACAKLARDKSGKYADCDYRSAQDMETGEIPCGRRDGCLCDDIAEHGDAISHAIRERGKAP